jgi:Yip1 domain
VGRSFGILGTYRLPLTTGLGLAIASLVLAAVGAVLLSIVIDALAPTFGAEKNREQALKVAVYSATPVWLAGVLQIVPALGVVVLLYLGLPRLMKCPAEKAMGYTGAVIACAVVIAIVDGTLVGTISGVEATGLIPAELAQP